MSQIPFTRTSTWSTQTTDTDAAKFLERMFDSIPNGIFAISPTYVQKSPYLYFGYKENGNRLTALAIARYSNSAYLVWYRNDEWTMTQVA